MKLLSQIPEITFDDVLILPGKTTMPINEDIAKIDISTKITKTLKLKIPITSAPMLNVSGMGLALTLGKLGGMSFIHNYQSFDDQVNIVATVSGNKVPVAASLDFSNPGALKHAENLWRNGASLICLETANAYNIQLLSFIKRIKGRFPKIEICAAVTVTSEAVLELIKAGIDCIRIGIGGGSHCTTRIITGIGRPQLSAVYECAKAAKRFDVPIISDGGIKDPGDIAKALVFGANAVTIGGLFAGTDKAPGRLINQNGKLYKLSWGMCVEESFGKTHKPNDGSDISVFSIIKSKLKSGWHLNQPREKLFTPLEEGSGGLIPYSGTTTELIEKFIKSLKRSLWYVGAKNLDELRQNAQVVLTSANTVQENFPRLEIRYK